MDYIKVLTVAIFAVLCVLPAEANPDGCFVCNKMWVLVDDTGNASSYSTETISIFSFEKQHSLLISSGGSEVRLKVQRMNIEGAIVTFYGHNGKVLLQVKTFPESNSFQVISIVLNSAILEGETYVFNKSLH